MEESGVLYRSLLFCGCRQAAVGPLDQQDDVGMSAVAQQGDEWESRLGAELRRHEGEEGPCGTLSFQQKAGVPPRFPSAASSGRKSSGRGSPPLYPSAENGSVPGPADVAAGGCRRTQLQVAMADDPAPQEIQSVMEATSRGAAWERQTSCFNGGSGMRSVASEASLAGGVIFDEHYDLFEPSISSQVKMMRMSDIKADVLHQRQTRQTSEHGPIRKRRTSVDQGATQLPLLQQDAVSEASEASDEDGNGSDRSDRSSSSSLPPNSTRNVSPGSSRASSARKPMLNRAMSAFDGDNVTNWGTVVAKLLRTRVHGISGATFFHIHKRKSTVELGARYILPSVRARAETVMKQARALSKVVSRDQVDKLDSSWQRDGILSYLFGEDYVDTIMLMANTLCKVLGAQPTVVQATAPARVFGDIHGQLRDLLLLLRAFGHPNKKSPSFVFNGDFVDRGCHSLHVVGILFAMKIIFPEKVWLVRGNHEDRTMNERYGFKDECEKLLGPSFGLKTYELIHRAFDYLPLACVISDKIMVVHGGIGEGKWTLNDLRNVKRPLKEKHLASDPMVWNVLWSDPIEDDFKSEKNSVFGVHQSPRSTTGLFKFGWNVTKTFCAANGLSLIIRSHQSMEGSLGFSVMHDRMLVRVFSARDYEEHGNDGAVILVSPQNPEKPTGPVVIRAQVVRCLAKLQANEETEAGTTPRLSHRTRRKSIGR